MAEPARRRMTLTQYAVVARQRRHVHPSVWMLVALTAGVLVIATGDNPFGVVLMSGLAAEGLLIAMIMRRSHHTGGVKVRTWRAALSSRSQRRVALWASALVLVSAGTGGAYILALSMPGGVPGWRPISLLLVSLGCLVYGVCSLIQSLRSSDLALCADGLTVSSPVTKPRMLGWDDIQLTTGTDERLVLVLGDGTEQSFPIAYQVTDPNVLRALIDRCSAYPEARARLGDTILADLLIDAAPDGSPPPGAPPVRLR